MGHRIRGIHWLGRAAGWAGVLFGCTVAWGQSGYDQGHKHHAGESKPQGQNMQPVGDVSSDKMACCLPELVEEADLTFAPNVPPPIQRTAPAVVKVHLDSGVKIMELAPGVQYKYWTFNGGVPGPFIRTRVGDVLELHMTNSDDSGMPHNVDFHAVTGPGGGATITTGVKGDLKFVRFKLLCPGLFIYHCAAPPVMDHIANGMYGLILVEPEGGLPKVDHEFYVLQSDFYAVDPSEMADDSGDAPDTPDTSGRTGEDDEVYPFSHQEGLMEHPRFVVFNGHVGSLTGEGALKAKTGQRVRIFFGNAGPNLISSFHVIGEIFDNVYREADLISPPAHGVQTTLVPAGGATVVEFGLEVPGTYTLVDHAIFRIEKGAVGFLEVQGDPRPDIFFSKDNPVPCPDCKVHP